MQLEALNPATQAQCLWLRIEQPLTTSLKCTGIIGPDQQGLPILGTAGVEIIESLLGSQALHKCQITLTVLHTIVARRMGVTQHEAMGINALFLQQSRNNLFWRLPLKDPAVVSQLQTPQRRAQQQAVTGTTQAPLTL